MNRYLESYNKNTSLFFFVHGEGGTGVKAKYKAFTTKNPRR